MKTAKPIDENELMELMAGKQPTPAPATAPIETEKAPQKLAPAKKKKAEGLTPEEKVEQAKLREEYIEGYRRTVRHHIEGIKIVDEEGNDVTPEKLRQVQREKGLHGRSLDDPNS